MIKKVLFTLIITISLTLNAFSAGSSGSTSSDGEGPGNSKSNFEKAVNHIEWAKKYEKKDKLDKAEKRYKKAQKLLLKLNSKKPDDADTLNYLGFTTRKLGDFKNGEKYYLQGLAINPTHIGINEYLGELYVATNRMDLAQKRLAVLMNCNCKEFDQLKDVIDGKKASKY